MRKAIQIILMLFVLAAVSYMLWRRNTQSWDEPAFDIDSAGPGVTALSELTEENGKERIAQGSEVADIPGVVPAEHHLVAYYFMNDVRCPSCVKIETWTHEALAAAFRDELATGALVWRMVNTDRPENNHFIKDYQIVTKQVILVELDQGNEVKWTNLAEVWSLLGDEEEFKQYIIAETRRQLAWLEQG